LPRRLDGKDGEDGEGVVLGVGFALGRGLALVVGSLGDDDGVA
jgi:hypothetical protein